MGDMEPPVSPKVVVPSTPYEENIKNILVEQDFLSAALFGTMSIQFCESVYVWRELENYFDRPRRCEIEASKITFPVYCE